jgi:hypothetical protein
MIHVDRIRTSSFRHRGVTRRIFVFLGSRTLKNCLKVVSEYAAGTKGYAVSRVIDISRSKFGAVVKMCSPVAFALGRLKLSTIPSLFGSDPTTKTIGIVDVADLAASAAGSEPAMRTVAPRNSSSASAGSRPFMIIVIQSRLGNRGVRVVTNANLPPAGATELMNFDGRARGAGSARQEDRPSRSLR